MGSKKEKAGKATSILIAEDSPTQALQLQHSLEKNGFAVTVARNGKEALSLMKKSRPAIVISDIIMPEMDGYDLCHHIKKDPNLGDIPVILLTQLSDPQDIIKGLQAGATNFITKPYDESLMLSRIQYILINQEVRREGSTEASINIYFMGKTYNITSDRMQIIDLLLSTYEHAVMQNKELQKTQAELRELNERLEDKVKQRTQRIERLNSVLHAIRGVNQLIVREKNPDRLIQKACATLTSARDHHNAWIALMDESGKLVTTAEAGLGKEFLALQRLLKGGKLVNCAQRALKKSGVVFIENPSTACADCPLAKESHARGSMAVRLEHGGKTFGLLSISIPKELVRDKEKLSLFEEVAGDIAFGLYNIEQEEQRKRGEYALRERTYELGERVKELGCLSNISMLIEKEDTSLEEILQDTVNLIPAAFQYPEITCARIILEDKGFRTENFREAPWKLTQDITVHAKSIGIMEVYYLEQKQERDEGPFMKEECNLLTLIAERLGHVIERLRAEGNLRHERDFVSRIMETSPVCIIMINREGQITFANPGAEEVLGLNPDEVTGRTHNSPEWRITDYDGKPFPDEHLPFRRVMDTGQPVYEVRHAIEWPDGRKVLLSINGAPLFDNAGKIEGVICTIQDMTEQTKTEKALKESETRYRSLVEQVPAITYTAALDEARTTLYVSPQIEAILGLSSEEYKDDPDFWQKHLHPEDRESVLSEIARAHDTGQPFVVDYRMATKDGREVWLRDEARIIKDEHESPLCLQGIMINITDRKLSEQKIKKSAENLEKMVEERTKELNRALYDAEQARDRIDGILKSVGDGLIVTDLYNRVILMNRAAEDLLRVRLSEVIDRPIDFAIEDTTLRNRIKNTLDKRESGYQFDFELPGDEPSNPRIIRGRTSMIEDKAEKHTGIITTMHDVTYEREVDRMKTEFISTAAHELRTPLTSIQGFSELLTTRDDITEDEKKECLFYINAQSVNLANIISDLLDISRIESGKGFSLDKAPCNIAELIRETLPSFQVQSKKHHFDLALPDEPLEAMVDKDKMRQVLENILSNAVKYSPEGGEIRITGEIVEDHYQVSIEDQGIGMTPDQIEKMFDKFYRADASNTAIPGTGLGMSIVAYLVETHGGEVWVASTHGKGTTVRFTIPM